MLRYILFFPYRLRRYRITASICDDFAKNPHFFIKNFWYEPPDLSNVTPIKWGNDNEKNAIEMFSNSYGSVKKCGLFISRKFPQFGASPDGIFQDYLVEVKCPYALKDTTPTNISNLTPAQRKTFFLISSENGVELDTKHKYYSQCQWQMFVTGFRKTKFVI